MLKIARMLRRVTLCFFAALILGICAFTGWLSLKHGLADRHAHNAKQLEKAWREQGNVDHQSLLDALAHLEDALELAPTHPEYLDHSARLLTLKYIFTKDEADAGLARARISASREVRPRWPGNWAAEIQLMIQDDSPPEAISVAIENTMRYGPFDPAAIQAVVRAGTIDFASLSEPAQAATLQAIKNGLNSRVTGLPNRTVQLAGFNRTSWPPELATAQMTLLIEKPWHPDSYAARLELVLLSWPFADNQQRNQAAAQIAVAINEQGRLLRQLRGYHHLPSLCPRLPRTEPIRKLCRG